MYQQLTIVGNLTQDPELRFTPSGVAVAAFGVAVNKSWIGQDGQRQEKVVFFRVTAWRKLAETVGQYLTKGRQVMVVGEIEEARAYQDREGNARASLEVTAQTVRFLGQRGEGSGGDVAAVSVADDKDIPF